MRVAWWSRRGAPVFGGAAIVVGAGLLGWFVLAGGPGWLIGAAGPVAGMGIGVLMGTYARRRAGRRI